MIMQTNPGSGRRKKAMTTYQLRVDLDGSQPHIWRRIQVPGSAKMGWLHAVLQVTLGWTNSHLHQFFCGKDTYGDLNVDSDYLDSDPLLLDENKFTLEMVLKEVGQSLTYEYDFGDSWNHTVTVEKIMRADLAAPTNAVCLAGECACPPEDCGGIWGYMELLKTLKNKKHPEHRRMKEWLGRSLDPQFFDIAVTNNWLRRLKWPRVTEAQLRKVLMARDGYQE